MLLSVHNNITSKTLYDLKFDPATFLSKSFPQISDKQRKTLLITLQTRYFINQCNLTKINLPPNFLILTSGQISLILSQIFQFHQCCDYAHIDSQHTMCVFSPRMCAQKKLLREYFPCISFKAYGKLSYF